MKDEEYNRSYELYQSYMKPYKESLSDSVTAMGIAILGITIEKIETDKKISERNDKIDKLLEE